jgi:nitrogen fixation NifU-like protein
MNDQDFDELIQKIQCEVFNEAKSVLGEKGFDRWRNPKYCGVMDGADCQAQMKGSCGDSMEMYLKISGERVEKASYVTDGCSSSSVAGSFASELATGKSFTEIFDLTGKDVLTEIGTFPREEEHCAHLAVRTLQKALENYLNEQIARYR